MPLYKIKKLVFLFKGKSKEAFGSSDALSPKYFEYKSNAGKLSISNKTLPF